MQETHCLERGASEDRGVSIEGLYIGRVAVLRKI